MSSIDRSRPLAVQVEEIRQHTKQRMAKARVLLAESEGLRARAMKAAAKLDIGLSELVADAREALEAAANTHKRELHETGAAQCGDYSFMARQKESRKRRIGDIVTSLELLHSRIACIERQLGISSDSSLIS